MNTLFIILSCLGGLIALVLIVALFTRKDYTIRKSILIRCPQADVFAYIRLMRHQDAYSAWNMRDPHAKKAYRGTDGTKGFVYTWDSANKQVGKGEQEITHITEGRQIDMELRFIKPFPGIARGYLRAEDAGQGQTRVSWGFSSSMNYPMNIMLVLLNLEKGLGNDMQTGLGNLKRILEKNAKPI